jgi:hypothetical protein
VALERGRVDPVDPLRERIFEIGHQHARELALLTRGSLARRRAIEGVTQIHD